MREGRSRKETQRQTLKTRPIQDSLLWEACNFLSTSREDFATTLVFQDKHEAHCDQSPPSSLLPPRRIWPLLFPK